MEIKIGDIWMWHKMGHPIVIPTNAGWDMYGVAVMGAGLAKDAATRYPELPTLYGTQCRKRRPFFPYVKERLILVPTKPLFEEAPYVSWKYPATVEQIQLCLTWLAQNGQSLFNVVGNKKIVVPMLGAGFGKLPFHVVAEMMERFLTPELFKVVHPSRKF